MSFRFRVSPRAARQIRAAAIWWSENRPKAPEALEDEIAKALELARNFPAAGESVRHSRIPGVRRILLARVHYHLYYRVVYDTETVEVLALSTRLTAA